MLGGLARIGRRLQDAVTGGAARTVDDAATSVRTTKRQPDITIPETTKTPDELLGTTARTSADDAVTAAGSGGGLSLSQKLLGGTVAAGATLGAVGVIGGPNTYPDGYRVDKTYTSQPQADRVKQTDADGNTVGYWVVVRADGKQVTYLTPSIGTATTSFPANRPPPFDSTGQADAAYDRWRSEARNDAQDPGTYRDQDERPRSAWGGASTTDSLGSGWHLYRQEHRTDDKTRYFVAGRNSGGNLIYLTAGGGVTTSPTPLPSEQDAREAFQGWKEDAQSGNVRGPDPGADRPGEDEIERNAPEPGGGGSGGGLLSLLLLGGGAAVIIALVTGVVL